MEQRHVSATQNRQADDVDVFLNGGGRNHLGRLVEAGIDDFHAGVAQCCSDDLRTTVMTVETGFGD